MLIGVDQEEQRVERDEPNGTSDGDGRKIFVDDVRKSVRFDPSKFRIENRRANRAGLGSVKNTSAISGKNTPTSEENPVRP